MDLLAALHDDITQPDLANETNTHTLVVLKVCVPHINLTNKEPCSLLAIWRTGLSVTQRPEGGGAEL